MNPEVLPTMVANDFRWRTLRRGGTAFALGAVLGFAAIILRSPFSGPGLHEVAGVVILAATAVALLGAAKTRRGEPRPWARLWAALAVLVLVGGLGGSLELSTLPSEFSFAPLIGLGALALLLIDALREGAPANPAAAGGRSATPPRSVPFDGSINEGSAGARQDDDLIRP